MLKTYMRRKIIIIENESTEFWEMERQAVGVDVGELVVGHLEHAQMRPRDGLRSGTQGAGEAGSRALEERDAVQLVVREVHEGERVPPRTRRGGREAGKQVALQQQLRHRLLLVLGCLERRHLPSAQIQRDPFGPSSLLLLSLRLPVSVFATSIHPLTCCFSSTLFGKKTGGEDDAPRCAPTV